jgi:hypothetical protein
MTFNEEHHRYLPPNLKLMLEEPPTRYEIYPKEGQELAEFRPIDE